MAYRSDVISERPNSNKVVVFLLMVDAILFIIKEGDADIVRVLVLLVILNRLFLNKLALTSHITHKWNLYRLFIGMLICRRSLN